MSAEKIVDGLVKYMQKNLVAREPITNELSAGGNVLNVDNTIRFEDGTEVAIAIDGSDDVEFNTILKIADENTIILLNPTIRHYGPSTGAVIQKSIGNTPLYVDNVLFGDREVIPIEYGIAITVEPVTNSNEWIGIPGLLDEEYSMSIMVYVRGDDHENTLRTSMKYSEAIKSLLNSKLHMDIVNDETQITAPLTAGGDIITIPSTDGWGVDDKFRYEVQDYNHVEIDFSIEEVISPTQLRINRPLLYNYPLSSNLKFIRRVFYLYDSRINNIEYGTVSKSSSLFKAAKLSWFGKQSDDLIFPQHSKS